MYEQTIVKELFIDHGQVCDILGKKIFYLYEVFPAEACVGQKGVLPPTG